MSLVCIERVVQEEAKQQEVRVVFRFSTFSRIDQERKATHWNGLVILLSLLMTVCNVCDLWALQRYIGIALVATAGRKLKYHKP